MFSPDVVNVPRHDSHGVMLHEIVATTVLHKDVVTLRYHGGFGGQEWTKHRITAPSAGGVRGVASEGTSIAGICKGKGERR